MCSLVGRNIGVNIDDEQYSYNLKEKELSTVPFLYDNKKQCFNKCCLKYSSTKSFQPNLAL